MGDVFRLLRAGLVCDDTVQRDDAIGYADVNVRQAVDLRIDTCQAIANGGIGCRVTCRPDHTLLGRRISLLCLRRINEQAQEGYH